MAALISDPSFNVRLTRNEIRVIGLALSGKLKARDDIALAADLNRRLLKEQAALLKNLLTAAEGALGAARSEGEDSRPERPTDSYRRIQAAYSKLQELSLGAGLQTPEAEALFKLIETTANAAASLSALTSLTAAFRAVAAAAPKRDLMELGMRVVDLDHCVRTSDLDFDP